MVIEKFIRYAELAVGLKPSARGCEDRLRGLERMNSSKTISRTPRDDAWLHVEPPDDDQPRDTTSRVAWKSW